MILFTCVGSPWVTARWGKEVKPEEKVVSDKQQNLSDRVLVPVANPSTEDNLLQLAILLTKKSKGTLLPLHVLSDKNEKISAKARMKQSQLLGVAEQIAHAATVKVEPIGRIDAAIARGIVRSATEHNASLVICGWKGYSTYKENFFGSTIDKIVRRSPVPVLITRCPQPIKNIARVFFAFTHAESLSWEFQQTLEIAKTIAAELKAKFHLLIIVTGASNPDFSLANLGLSENTPIQEIQANFVIKVTRMLTADDLLILTSGTHQYHGFGLSNGLVEPEAIVRLKPDIATIVVHFPILS